MTSSGRLGFPGSRGRRPRSSLLKIAWPCGKLSTGLSSTGPSVFSSTVRRRVSRRAHSRVLSGFGFLTAALLIGSVVRGSDPLTVLAESDLENQRPLGSLCPEYMRTPPVRIRYHAVLRSLTRCRSPLPLGPRPRLRAVRGRVRRAPGRDERDRSARRAFPASADWRGGRPRRPRRRPKLGDGDGGADAAAAPRPSLRPRVRASLPRPSRASSGPRGSTTPALVGRPAARLANLSRPT